jgi:Kef-type K+ transport system membrane component KefB
VPWHEPSDSRRCSASLWPACYWAHLSADFSIPTKRSFTYSLRLASSFCCSRPAWKPTFSSYSESAARRRRLPSLASCFHASCRALGLGNLQAVVAGATLTATSVGITARVLADLNRLHEPESHIILGAAIIDDIIGLVILALVAGLTSGEEIAIFGIVKTSCVAFGFLAGTLLAGRLIVPWLIRLVTKVSSPAALTTLAIMFAFGLSWLAATAGSAMIIGAFVAGLLLRESSHVESIERGISPLGHFFVPIFFVAVGSAVDVRMLNPFDPANGTTLLVGSMLIVAAVVGKFLAGYAPFWFRGNKKVIGVGMIPRGEVGLIFAQMGFTSGVFDRALFSAVTTMIVVTTFMVPPLLKYLFPSDRTMETSDERIGMETLVNEP